MITYKELKRAVVNVIENNFENIPINSKDISEGFERPSFFVELDNIQKSSTVDHYTKSLLVRIYYFPTTINESSLELLDIRDELENAFDLKLAVKDRHLNIDETDAIESDGVLQFEFSLEFSDSKNKESSPLMLELEYK